MGIKNQIIEQVLVEKVADQGKCLTRIDDRVLFIRNTAPGDVVDVRITRKKKRFLEGVPVKFHKLSEIRVEPFCPHFQLCGGCKWQHLPYDKQLEFKRQEVTDQFRHIGKLEFAEVNEVLAAPDQQFYRNKLEFTFTNRRWVTGEEIEQGNVLNWNGLGFHLNERFDKILDLEVCFLQPEPSNQIRLAAKKLADSMNLEFYDVVSHQGYLRNLVLRNNSAGQVMLILQIAQPDSNAAEELLKALLRQFPQVISAYYVVNTKKNDSFADLEPVHFAGEVYLTEELEIPDTGHKVAIRIGPKSFFQTNTVQTVQLYKQIRQLANLSGVETVYDLYTGAGSIACFLADRAKKIVGLEYVKEAVEDARENATLNGFSNLFFEAGDIRELLQSGLTESLGKPEVVITDPPRAGMHEDVVRQLLQLAPQRIVYVSCNPATQARDLSILSANYEIKVVQPVDMFPHTQHIENVVQLIKRT